MKVAMAGGKADINMNLTKSDNISTSANAHYGNKCSRTRRRRRLGHAGRWWGSNPELVLLLWCYSPTTVKRHRLPHHHNKASHGRMASRKHSCVSAGSSIARRSQKNLTILPGSALGDQTMLHRETLRQGRHAPVNIKKRLGISQARPTRNKMESEPGI